MISFRQRQFSSVEIVKVCHSSALVDWGKRGWSNREKYHMNYPTCLLHNCSPPRESPTSRNPTTALNIYSKDFPEEEISASDEIPKKWPHLLSRNRLRREILFVKTFHLRGLLRKVGQQDFQRRG